MSLQTIIDWNNLIFPFVMLVYIIYNIKNNHKKGILIEELKQTVLYQTEKLQLYVELYNILVNLNKSIIKGEGKIKEGEKEKASKNL